MNSLYWPKRSVGFNLRVLIDPRKQGQKRSEAGLLRDFLATRKRNGR